MEPSVQFCRNREGDRLAYMTWGEGPVLVWPPGWVSHLELQWRYLGMRDFVERLAESFQLVFYDKRGCGLSERDRDDVSLAADLADLEVIVDRATEGPVSVFGDSMGAPYRSPTPRPTPIAPGTWCSSAPSTTGSSSARRRSGAR